MRIIRETCVAGKTIDRTVKISSGNHTGKRGPRKNPTLEKVQKNNDRLAIKHLTRILNANFEHGDVHYTLTYSEEPTKKEAAADRDKFIRTLRKKFEKEGKELKYVAVTEYENKRIHHHIVINSNDIVTISEAWKKGYVKSSVLDDTGNYQQLAEYLIKETQKTFRLPDSERKRRWTGSRNLIKPVVKKEYVDISELWNDPQPIPGYYIPKDSVRRYQHPITELEHLEYIMIAIDKPRSYKIWPRGVKTTHKEHFKVETEKQLAYSFE